MKKLITLRALALLAVASQALAQDITKVDKYAFPPLPQELKHADSLLATGDSTNGLAELREIVNSKANDELKARSQYLIAEFYGEIKLKNKGENKKLYRRLSKDYYLEVAKDTANPLVPWALFNAAFFAETDTERLSLLRQVATTYEGSVVGGKAQHFLANTLMMNFKHDVAIVEYKKYLAKYTDNRFWSAEALFNIGQCTKGANKRDFYWEVIKTYSDQDHWVLLSYVRIADGYKAGGDVKKAINIQLEAASKCPNNAPGLLLEAYVNYQSIQEWEKADAIKQRIINEYPSSDEAHTLNKKY